jgi:hypothetical protein
MVSNLNRGGSSQLACCDASQTASSAAAALTVLMLALTFSVLPEVRTLLMRQLERARHCTGMEKGPGGQGREVVNVMLRVLHLALSS